MKTLATFAIAISMLSAQDLPVPTPALAPLPPRPDGKIRIFVGDSEAFVASSFGAGSGKGAMGGSSASTQKFTVLTMKEVNSRCKSVIIVNRPDISDLFLRLDMSIAFFTVRADMAVFNREGEMVFAASSVALRRDVKRFCESSVFGPRPVKGKKPPPDA